MNEPDEDWPCPVCGGNELYCWCVTADSCEDCGEYFNHCECERDLEETLTPSALGRTISL